jgi:hypothetical protein
MLLFNSLWRIGLLASLTAGWIIDLAYGRQTSLDCSFFQPDDFVFESTRIDLAEGLLCIEEIEGFAEEIFLVMDSPGHAVFVDIGYNAQHTERSSSAVFALDDLADYVMRKWSGEELYLVHNHPRFENIPVAPPSFADLVVLSNLQLHLAELDLNVDITGLVVNSGGGIWHFNTTPELEASTMIPLRGSETIMQPFSRWSPAMKINMKHTLGWAKIWKDYPEDPWQMAEAMRQKGVEVVFYPTVEAFTKRQSESTQ